MAWDLGDAARGRARDEAEESDRSCKRDPVKAVLQGRCDVDGARRELAFDTRAEAREAAVDTETGARGQDQKPGTKDEGKRWQQRSVVDREEWEGRSGRVSTFSDSSRPARSELPNAAVLTLLTQYDLQHFTASLYGRCSC